MGRYIILYGGMDLKDSALSDIWVLDLVTQKWNEITLTLPATYFHTMTVCYDKDRKLENIVSTRRLERKFTDI